MQDQWPLISLLNNLHFGMNVQEAIDSPTWNSLHLPSSFMTRASSRRVVRMESRVPRNTRRELERRGHICEVDNNVGLVGGDSEVDLDA
jgi:gamma-glutamyltranspeptidase/glutathione hydrolase